MVQVDCSHEVDEMVQVDGKVQGSVCYAVGRRVQVGEEGSADYTVGRGSCGHGESSSHVLWILQSA